MRIALVFALVSFITQAATSYQFTGNRLPEGWAAVRGGAAVDPAVARDGRSSLRIESSGEDAAVLSSQVTLTPGKSYEIRAWVRTERLDVRDLDRTPVATGASVSMASMPFDVHSASVGGTRDWTRLALRFIATHSKDRIRLSVAEGGAFSGKAWFDGVTLDEVSGGNGWPSKPALRTFGPAYRHPTGGWIYLHIQGEPYERGYQHGYLMAREIETYIDRCASQLDSKSKDRAWQNGRTTANALFLRGFDKEILQEMRGIAEGAAAAGAKWNGRTVDLDDIVAANTVTELGLLHSAMPKTPYGLEGLKLQRPEYFDPKRDVGVTERCSAFAATGKATRDGKMVIAHLTMWPLTLAEQTNVMLDIQPTTGRRVLMQAYPGGIQSGTDYYQNDAGVVLTETTIEQSPFNIEGTPVAYRARKAIQYGTSIDQVVEYLSAKNNGLYTNEWLIGDGKTDEIAMFELGTYKTKLFRSAKNDWFGGTEGFYWGCNNAKDLSVRLEHVPDPAARPRHLPFVPSARDLKWLELYDRHKGKIDEQFAFLAFRTAPLVSPTTFDAKVTDSEMALQMMSWAVFGKPNQREWIPSTWQKEQYPGNMGIHSSGYRLIHATASAELKKMLSDTERERLARKPSPPSEPTKKTAYEDRLWKGWILPASDADLWLSAGSAAYYETLKRDNLADALEAHRARVRGLGSRAAVPLGGLQSGVRSNDWHTLAMNKGALLLDALRVEMGDDRFFEFMRDFFAKNTTQSVTTLQFREAAGERYVPLFARWLESGLPVDSAGPSYVLADLFSRLGSAMIVYGTVLDAGANRYAAEQLQKHLLDRFESAVQTRKDFEASDAELRARNIIFIGRPESNSALDAVASRIGLQYDAAAFRLDSSDYASEYDAVAFAAASPLDSSRMMVVLSGNSALETVRLPASSLRDTQYVVFREGKQKQAGFLKQ